MVILRVILFDFCLFLVLASTSPQIAHSKRRIQGTCKWEDCSKSNTDCPARVRLFLQHRKTATLSLKIIKIEVLQKMVTLANT